MTGILRYNNWNNIQSGRKGRKKTREGFWQFLNLFLCSTLLISLQKKHGKCEIKKDLRAEYFLAYFFLRNFM